MFPESLSAAAWGTIVLVATPAHASFNVFQGYDPSIVVNLNISSTCMAALNETVDCDQNTATMAAWGVDNNYWYADNITTLCTATCSGSLDQWMASVEDACAADVIWQSDTLVEAKIVPLQYTYYYSVACLQDEAGDWCMLASQEWQGSDYMRYDADFCWQDPVPDLCNEDGFSIAEINATMEAVPLLYDPDLYCSDCFLLHWRQRLLSPLLPVSNFTDYLIEQFDYMQGNCSTTLPYTTSASTLFLGISTAATATTTATGTAAAITATCTGQLVAPLATPLSCNELADTYNTSTGDLRVATDDYFCTINATVCLPPPCPTTVVTTFGQTCDGYASQLSNATYNVTSAVFYGWNLNIQGSCDDLAIDQRICIGPPGGFWVANGSAYAPTATTAYHTTATPATPTQTGSVADCGLYYSVVSGDTCNQICLVYGISFATLQALNPYLNDACTNLWLGYSICVTEVTPDPVSTNGLCGPSNDYATCNGTAFGSCCSTSGYCGDGDAYCSSGHCFSGACTGPTSGVTTNGTCGPSWGDLTCDNADFGPCCSIYGYCGDGTDYCGAGNCYSGACETDNGGPSINGECGPLFAGNKTCTGTQFGNCCSTSGYCGNSSDYCGAGNCYTGACLG